MELGVDVSEMIRKSIYKRWYGDEWEARLKETLIRNVLARTMLRNRPGYDYWCGSLSCHSLAILSMEAETL